MNQLFEASFVDRFFFLNPEFEKIATSSSIPQVFKFFILIRQLVPFMFLHTTLFRKMFFANELKVLRMNKEVEETEQV